MLFLCALVFPNGNACRVNSKFLGDFQVQGLQMKPCGLTQILEIVCSSGQRLSGYTACVFPCIAATRTALKRMLCNQVCTCSWAVQKKGKLRLNVAMISLQVPLSANRNKIK